MSDTVTVRDAIERIAHYPQDQCVRWAGRSYVYTADGYRWEDQPMPEPGDRVSMSDFQRAMHWTSRDERIAEATHILVPNTMWGDYCGDDFARSNARSMTRDYPGVFVTGTGDYGSEALYLALDAEVPESLIDGLNFLLDYPLWDESDHSDLVIELEQGAWDSWGSHDLMVEVRDLADSEEVDTYLDTLDGPEWNNLASDAAYDLPNGHPMFVAEDASGNGYWEGFRDVWAPAILRRIHEVLDARDLPAEWQPVPQCDGQIPLPTA